MDFVFNVQKERAIFILICNLTLIFTAVCAFLHIIIGLFISTEYIPARYCLRKLHTSASYELNSMKKIDYKYDLERSMPIVVISEKV
jgi:hypothetical protein